MPQILILLFNTFSGPLINLLDKLILSGAVWLVAKASTAGIVLDAPSIAAIGYAILSGLKSIVTGTQAAKMQSINSTDNGAVVVPASSAAKSGIAPVSAPVDTASSNIP